MLQGLREALRVSPNNIPLRQHLAESLLNCGRLEEAEKEFREALSLAPNSQSLQLGLARAFYSQGKNTQALVIVESLLKNDNAPARARLFHARLLFRSGDVEEAVREYRLAVEADPSLKDFEFASRLGIGAEPETSEVVEGKVRASWEEEPSPVEKELDVPAFNSKMLAAWRLSKRRFG